MIDQIVLIVLYMMLPLGIIILFLDSFEALLRSIRLRHRLTAAHRAGKQDSVIAYFNKLLFAATGKGSNGKAFAAALLGIFLLVFAVGFPSLGLMKSCFAALLCAAVPLILLYIRLEDGRNKSSREGISLVSELYRNYRICDNNIAEAIQASIASKSEFPICKRLLYKLLLRLRSAAGPEEIKEACNSFAFALGTVWGYMLSTCIKMSAEKGTDISEGLLDISRQLKEANKRAENRKNLNSESARMTVFLVPLLYLGSIYASVKVLEVPVSDFMRNQFLTEEGFVFFIVILLMFFANIILNRLVLAVRVDY